MDRTIAELSETEFLNKLSEELITFQNMKKENNIIWMINRRAKSIENRENRESSLNLNNTTEKNGLDKE